MVIGTNPVGLEVRSACGSSESLGNWALTGSSSLLLRFRRPGGNLGELIPLNAGVDVSDAAGWCAPFGGQSGGTAPLTER